MAVVAFKSGPGSVFKGHRKLAAVGLFHEFKSGKSGRGDNQAYDEARGNDEHHLIRISQAPSEDQSVLVGEPFEGPFKNLPEPVQKALRIYRFKFCKAGCEDGGDGKRDQQAGEGRNEDDDGESADDIANEPGGQGEGDEYHDVDKGNGDGCKTDLVTAPDGSRELVFAFFEVMVDVLKNDNAVVDQDTNDQRQSQ